MKIRTGANRKINEGEKKKRKEKKSRNRRQSALKRVTSPNDTKDGNS